MLPLRRSVRPGAVARFHPRWASAVSTPTAVADPISRKIRQQGIGTVTMRTVEAEGPQVGTDPIRTTRSARVKFASPLRYPGGKAALAPFLGETITLNGLSGCTYFEPFAGGAGTALQLLRNGVVSEVHINDIDPCIVAFWRSVLGEPERFADAIMSAKLDVDEWKRQRGIYKSQDASKQFDLGFATFYLNRCNRSGVLSGAAPIGGYEQTGKWKIDARFYRESLGHTSDRAWPTSGTDTHHRHGRSPVSGGKVAARTSARPRLRLSRPSLLAQGQPALLKRLFTQGS